LRQSSKFRLKPESGWSLRWYAYASRLISP
jgi:hypothetical protein